VRDGDIECARQNMHGPEITYGISLFKKEIAWGMGRMHVWRGR
jgi:hypothetical protein